MITLKDIIEEYMLIISDPEHLLHGINKTLVLRSAKRGWEDLYYDVMPETVTYIDKVKSNYSLSLPEGTIDWIRISVLNPQNNQLVPLYKNNKNPLAISYLKDETGETLIDEDGYFLMGMSGTPGEINESNDNLNVGLEYFWGYPYHHQLGARFNISGGVISYGGNYTYDNVSKKFYFYDIPEDTDIYFELIQLPNVYEKDESKISVHEYIREAMFAYISKTLMQERSSIPQYEKNNAIVRYNREKRKAKKRLIIKPEEILQALRTQRGFLNKW